MAQVLESRLAERSKTKRVVPSRVDPSAKPYQAGQELEPLGRWTGEPIWAPPTGVARDLAETMHQRTGLFVSQEKRWEAVVDAHRNEFTQVREIELHKASIRLPQGRFFVSITERDHFDTIEEEIPACVQTRLDEFLEGPGKRHGVKIYYLKPLCVEVCDHLVLTKGEDLTRTIEKIREEVFAEYKEMVGLWRMRDAAVAAVRAALAVPRGVIQYFVKRRQKALAAYQARLEFKRRKTALGAARTYRKCRTTPCSFDDMYALTNPLKESEVVHQYGVDQKQSRSWRDQLMAQLVTQIGNGVGSNSPWLVTLSLVVAQIAELSLMAAPAVVVCDPIFVAEMPDAPGELLKIGHFDEVDGVLHIEI